MGNKRPPAHRTSPLLDRARPHALSIILQLVCAFAFLDILPASVAYDGAPSASSRAQSDSFTAVLSSLTGEEEDIQSPATPDNAVAPNLFALAIPPSFHLTGAFDGTRLRFGEFTAAYPARAPPLVLLS